LKIPPTLLGRADEVPLALIYWSRDPDDTQHAQGDTLNTVNARHQGPDLE
jgi:hypothetical protein